jgi:hypothetical protein
MQLNARWQEVLQGRIELQFIAKSHVGEQRSGERFRYGTNFVDGVAAGFFGRVGLDPSVTADLFFVAIHDADNAADNGIGIEKRLHERIDLAKIGRRDWRYGQ